MKKILTCLSYVLVIGAGVYSSNAFANGAGGALAGVMYAFPGVMIEQLNGGKYDLACQYSQTLRLSYEVFGYQNLWKPIATGDIKSSLTDIQNFCSAHNTSLLPKAVSALTLLSPN